MLLEVFLSGGVTTDDANLEVDVLNTAVAKALVFPAKPSTTEPSEGSEGGNQTSESSSSVGSSQGSSVRASPGWVGARSPWAQTPSLSSQPRQIQNRHKLVRVALAKLATEIKQRDPTGRPTAAELLAELGNIQLCLP